MNNESIRLIVELITAPLLSLKKAVVSEPPPPKLILTGDLDLAVINFSNLEGMVFLVINFNNLFLSSKTGMNVISWSSFL